MSKLWLPFYDIGGPVGYGVANHPIDVELVTFLYDAVKARLVRSGASAPVFSVKGEAGKMFIAQLCKMLGHSGYAVTQSAQGVVRPASQDPDSAIVALNAMFYRLHPDKFLSGHLTFATSGSLVAGGLLYHLNSPGAIRSPWLGLKASGPGPQRELPFYDVQATIFHNPAIDVIYNLVDPLAAHMMKMICTANSVAKPTQFGSYASNPTAALSCATVNAFAQKFVELGWICPDMVNIQPTQGNVDSPSLIVPINFYAQEACKAGMVGLYGTGYHQMMKSPFLPAVTKSALQTNRHSRYFKAAA